MRHAITPCNCTERLDAENIPMHIEDEQRDQGNGSLAVMRLVLLTSTTAGSSNQDADIQQQQLQYVAAELNAADATCAYFWRQQGRNALKCQQPGFESVAHPLEQSSPGSDRNGSRWVQSSNASRSDCGPIEGSTCCRNSMC